MYGESTKDGDDDDMSCIEEKGGGRKERETWVNVARIYDDNEHENILPMHCSGRNFFRQRDAKVKDLNWRNKLKEMM